MTATVAHSPTLGLALLVALAGGVGAMARALLIHHFSVRRSDPLPIGTVVVNASGSLVLGFLTGLSHLPRAGPPIPQRGRDRTVWRLHHILDGQLGVPAPRAYAASGGRRSSTPSADWPPVWAGPSPAWPWPRSSEATRNCGRATSRARLRLRAGVEGRHQGARRSSFVDPSHRRRAGSLAQRFPRCRLGGNLLERLSQGLERLEAFGLGRLDHERFVDDEREVDGGRMEALLEQPLADVECLGPVAPS